MKFTISTKLKLLAGVLLLSLCVLGVSTLVQTSDLEKQLYRITEVDEPASTASLKMEIEVLAAGHDLIAYLRDYDPSRLEEIQKHEAIFLQLGKDFKEKVRGTETEKLSTQIDENFERFRKARKELTAAASQRESGTESPLVVSEITEFESSRNALIKLLGNDVQVLLHEDLDKAKEAAHKDVSWLNGIVISVFTVSVIVGLWVAWWTTRTILGSISSLKSGVAKIGEGDLSHRIEQSSEDELGELAEAFNDMAQNLHYQKTTVHEAITRLQSISSEILASTAQQASGMEEQSASVSETVTTMTELGQTVEEASERATTVRELVKKTVEDGRTGREAVQQSVGAMDKVRQQVNSIAENNLSLAERAQAIGDIIATVNDVTDQTNLLALNAAVEAARAGEYGKGFGVVASEIKSLAEQSRQATQQVSQILGDIQKATNAAVLATEQGTRDSDEATKVVQKAGECIDMLSHSLEESSRMAAQISASSGQQAIGVKQVNEAMGHIETVAREQVAATRQVEAAMRDLQNLSQELGNLVDDRQTQSQTIPFPESKQAMPKAA